MMIESRFDIGQEVRIDGDLTFKATITAILWRGPKAGYVCYQVAYLLAGANHEPYIEHYRLTAVSATADRGVRS